MIYILSAPIQTGKTTTLGRIIVQLNNVGGFLSPTIDGLRKLQNMQSNEIINFGASQEKENTIPVGRFHFYSNAFDNASEWTLEHIESKVQWIVIDELGKLELQGKGFHKLARQIIPLDWSKQNLLLVVRDFLLEEIIEKYSIKDCKILMTRDLQEIFTR